MADVKVEKPVEAVKEDKKAEEKKVEVPNFIQRVKITNQYTHGKVTLREYDNISQIDGAPLIQGFPNPTSDNMITGIIITSYIIQHLNLPLVGDLISPSFPPMAVIKSGIPAPGARIYGNKNLVVMASEYTVKDAEILHDVVTATLQFAERHKLSLVIGLDAVAGNLSESTNLLDQIQIQAEHADEMGEGDDDYEDIDDDGEEDAMENIGGDNKIGINELAVAPAQTKKTPKSPAVAEAAIHDKKADSVKLVGKSKADDKKKSKKDGDKKSVDKKKKKQEKASAEDEGSDDDDDDDEKDEKTEVWFITNSELHGNALKSLDMAPCVEAAINGVQGGLINESRFTEVPIVLMLAGLDKLELGARPALVLIQAIEKLLTKVTNASLGIDISKLQESTTSLEGKIGELMKKMQQGPAKPDDSKMNMLYM